MEANVITYDLKESANKLFCTFTQKESLNETLLEIQRRYSIVYGKIFVLESAETQEYVCTYNIDSFNVQDNSLIFNTILCHRRKETATLYTINALNKLIASLNGGVVDHNFVVGWKDYRNSILLTRTGELTILPTKIFKIIELS